MLDDIQIHKKVFFFSFSTALGVLIFVLTIFILSEEIDFDSIRQSNYSTNKTSQVDLQENKKQDIFVEKEIHLDYTQNLSMVLDCHNQIMTSTKELPSFIQFDESHLTILPDYKHIGVYEIHLEGGTKNFDCSYDYQLEITLPEVNFKELQAEVEYIIGEEDSDKYGVYIYDLKREKGFDINGNKEFRPGSVSKILYAVIALRDVDSGKRTLSSFEHTLIRMINYSSNEAMMEIDHMLGGQYIFNERVKKELGITKFFRIPHICTPQQIGEVLEGFYSGKYLSKEMNDYLLNMLFKNTGYDNRLLRGLPDDINIAHKTGWIDTEFGEGYQDVALVYGKETDLVIVVVNKDTSRFKVMPKMKSIASKVYNTLN